MSETQLVVLKPFNKIIHIYTELYIIRPDPACWHLCKPNSVGHDLAHKLPSG